MTDGTDGSAQRALAGGNAAVIGLLAATLYDPVLAEGILQEGE